MMGAGLAKTVTSTADLIMIVAYVSRQRDIADAWYLPTMETFSNLGVFVKLAMPGVLMLFLENLNMEVLVLMAGLMHDVNQSAA